MNFIDFKIIDAIDIIVAALLLWQIYRVIRGTAAMTITAGIFALYLLWVVVTRLGMELLSMILGQVIGIGAIALLIVFQQEVRRYLLMIGKRYADPGKGLFHKLFHKSNSKTNDQSTEEIIGACYAMSATRTGALIAIERTTDLSMYATTGDKIDAVISKRLIENIFFKNTPLHDGAMIIKNDRIWAPRCILPSSDNPHIPAHLGMRHRAAIGLTEHSDALVIVVSEETGKISIVESGNIKVIKSEQEIIDRLTATE